MTKIISGPLCYVRQIVDVFIIMAYDDNKLKGRPDDLTVTAQYEAMIMELEGVVATLHLKEDLSSILLCNQFTGHKLPSEFHDHDNALRDMTPLGRSGLRGIILSVVRTIRSSAIIFISSTGY